MKHKPLLLCALGVGGLVYVQFSHAGRTHVDPPFVAADDVPLARVTPRPRVELPFGKPIRGDAERLWKRYQDWKSQVATEEAGTSFMFPLRAQRRGSEFGAGAKGLATIDLASGHVVVDVEGDVASRRLELVLVDNRGEGGGSPMPTDEDVRLHVGELVASETGARFEGRLPSRLPAGFEIDQVFVAEVGAELMEGMVLYAAPSLFQRLLAYEFAAERASTDRALLLGIAMPAQLGGPLGIGPIGALVAQGEDLFFNETFAGNQRTCGTCHPMDNNFTIDPDFISKLPNTDPLFVAEFIPALTWELNGNRRFENPTLMRKLGLIVENLDGFSNLQKMFTMRSVPHTFAQGVSIQAGNGIMPPNERTGWSGDGAPHDPVFGIPTTGTLFDFALGAVVQHFPLTTARQLGVDFNLPNNTELTAMEAFQLSLGRQTDFDLNTMVFNDPDTEKGKQLFAQSACNKCHPNAGAGQPNFNFDTGVEEFMLNNPDITGEPRPADGGFGTDPFGNFPTIPVPNNGSDPNKPAGSFGNGEFNTPSIVEAADTGPWFHNNITFGQIEDTIDFYRSAEFFQAQGFTVSFPGAGRSQVGKFLRAINTVDNIDTGILSAWRAHDATAFAPVSIFDPQHHDAVNLFLRFTLSDIDDCLRVLGHVNLSPVAQKFLEEAKCYFFWAMAPADWDKRRKLIEHGIYLMKLARQDITP